MAQSMMQRSTGSHLSSFSQQSQMLSSAGNASPFSGNVALFRNLHEGLGFPHSSSAHMAPGRFLLSAPSFPEKQAHGKKGVKGDKSRPTMSGVGTVPSVPVEKAKSVAPRAVAEGRTAQTDLSKNTLDELSFLPGASSPYTPLNYSDIIQLIDVQRPYYSLFDVAQINDAAKPTVRGYFLKESMRHQETRDPISGSELGRHCAIMGSVACAMANPVKDKHYYLAFGAKFERLQGGGDGRTYEPVHSQAVPARALDQSESGGLFEAVAENTMFRRGMAKSVVTVFHWEESGAFEVYGRFEITYVVLTSDAFLKTVPPLPTGYIPSSNFSPDGLTGDETSSSVNPYLNPVSLIETPELHTAVTRTGVIDFSDPSIAEGHFPLLPALPVSVLGSNALRCATYFGELENCRMLNCKLKFGKLAWFGQEVRLVGTRTGEKAYKVVFKVGEDQIGSMEADFEV